MNKKHDKKGRFAPALDKKQMTIVKRWVKSGIPLNRLQGKIMLHFGVSHNTARKIAKEAS